MKSRLLTYLVAFICLPLAMAGAGGTMHSSSPDTRQEIVAIVEDQLSAMREKRWSTAYQDLASGVRAMIPMRHFVRTMQRSYPLLCHHVRAEVGATLDDDHWARVEVRLFAEDEHIDIIPYRLVKEQSGWRVFAFGSTPLQDGGD